MFKKEKIRILNILISLIVISALITSLSGIVFPDIYKSIVAEEEMTFVFAQDLISFIGAALMLIITFFMKKDNVKLDIIKIGIVGYLLYAYGQYVMGTVYNYFYFSYLFIFSLSIFYLINVFAAIECERFEFVVPKSLRIIIAIYCTAIVVFFAPQWIIEIFHHIQKGSRPGADGLTFNYYVYIIDLVFVLPIGAVASFSLFKKKNPGFILGGIYLIFGFVLMLWVALGFLCQPLFHLNMDINGTAQFSIISFVFLVLCIFYFKYLEVRKTCSAQN
jgi:hypothetical protein